MAAYKCLTEMFWMHDDLNYHHVTVRLGHLPVTAKYLDDTHGGAYNMRSSDRVICWRHHSNVLDIIERSFSGTFETVPLRLTFGETFVLPSVNIFESGEFLFILLGTTHAIYRIYIKVPQSLDDTVSLLGQLAHFPFAAPNVYHHMMAKNGTFMSYALETGETVFMYLVDGYLNVIKFDTFTSKAREFSLILSTDDDLIALNMDTLIFNERRTPFNLSCFKLFPIGNAELYLATIDERHYVNLWNFSNYYREYSFSLEKFDALSSCDVLFFDVSSTGTSSITLMIGSKSDEMMVALCEVKRNSSGKCTKHTIHICQKVNDLSASNYRSHDSFDTKKYLFFTEPHNDPSKSIFFFNASDKNGFICVNTQTFPQNKASNIDADENYYLSDLFNSRLFSRSALNKAISVFQREAVPENLDYDNLKALAVCLSCDACDKSKFWKTLYGNVIKFQANEWTPLACFDGTDELKFILRKNSLSVLCNDSSIWKHVFVDFKPSMREFVTSLQHIINKIDLDALHCSTVENDFSLANVVDPADDAVDHFLTKVFSEKMFLKVCESFESSLFSTIKNSSFVFNGFSACIKSRLSMYILEKRICIGLALMLLNNYLKVKTLINADSLLTIINFYRCCLVILNSSSSLPSVKDLQAHTQFVKKILSTPFVNWPIHSSKRLICDEYVPYLGTEHVCDILSSTLSSDLAKFLFLAFQFDLLQRLLANQLWTEKNSSLKYLLQGLMNIYYQQQQTAIDCLDKFISDSVNVTSTLNQFLFVDSDEKNSNSNILSLFLSRLINSVDIFGSNEVLSFLLKKADQYMSTEEMTTLIDWQHCFTFALTNEHFILCYDILKMIPLFVVQYQCFINLAKVLYEDLKTEQLLHLCDLGLTLRVPIDLLSIWEVFLKNLETYDLSRCEIISRLYFHRNDYRNAAKVLIEYALKMSRSERTENSLVCEYDLYINAYEIIGQLETEHRWVLINKAVVGDKMKNEIRTYGAEENSEKQIDDETFAVWSIEDLKKRLLILRLVLKLLKYIVLPTEYYDDVEVIFIELFKVDLFDDAVLIYESFEINLCPMLIHICARYCVAPDAPSLSLDNETLLANNQSLIEVPNDDVCPVLKAYVLRYPTLDHLISCLLTFFTYDLMPPTWFIQKFLAVDGPVLIRMFIMNGSFSDAVGICLHALNDILTKCKSGDIEEFNVSCAPISMFDQLMCRIKSEMSDNPEYEMLYRHLDSSIRQYMNEMESVAEGRFLQYNSA